MSRRKGRIRLFEWRAIALQVHPSFTARSIQDRWYNFLRPPLDRGEFTVEERRAAARAAVQRPGNWVFVASQIGNGKTRSPAMVKHAVALFAQKCKQAGFMVTRPEDIDLLPVEAFQWGFPKGEEGKALVREYNVRKYRYDLQHFAPMRQRFSIQSLLVDGPETADGTPD
jgi:hypothetical protein